MSVSAVLNQSINSGGKTSTSSETYENEGRDDRSVPVADSVTDQQILFAMDISQLKMFYMQSDQDLTIEFNSASVPAPLIALKAGIPFIWTTDTYYVNLFLVDITQIFATNASGSAATLELFSIHDTTP